MAPVVPSAVSSEIDYPVADCRPMGETPIHRRNITNLIEMLDAWYAGDPMVYVSGNMFIYYVRGDRYKTLAPDVFVVKGIRKTPERRCYLVWEEGGKAPNVIIELTSASSRDEDSEDKFIIYRDQLRVQEYFLFDPEGDYLDPPLRGFRLRDGEYHPIELVDGRLPSEVLGLHLEQSGLQLRLYDPAAGKWLLTPAEEREARQQAEAEVQRLSRELESLRQNQAKNQ